MFTGRALDLRMPSARRRARVFNPADPRPRWAPPPLINPITVNVPATGFYQSPVYADDQDVIFVMPAAMRPVNSDTEFRGARNIVVIGGHLRSRLTVKDFTGHLYIEGLEIDMTGAPNKDALSISGKAGFRPDVTIQNYRAYGIQGTFAGTHSDGFQPWGDLGVVRFDLCYISTNYQGIFGRAEYRIAALIISRTYVEFNDLGTPANNTYGYWFRNPAGVAPPVGQDPLFPVDLIEAYGAQHETRVPAMAAAYPPPGEAIYGFVGEVASVDGNGRIIWMPGVGITGGVNMGAPAGDIWHPPTAAEVGVNYVASTSFQGV